MKTEILKEVFQAKLLLEKKGEQSAQNKFHTLCQKAPFQIHTL